MSNINTPLPTLKIDTTHRGESFSLMVVIVLIIAGFGLFHIVGTGVGFTIIPKSNFTFANTFTSVDKVLEQANGRSFAQMMQGGPQLDNLLRQLAEKGLISSSKPSDQTNDLIQ